MDKKDKQVALGKRFALSVVSLAFIVSLKTYCKFKCNTDDEVQKWKNEDEGFIVLSEHPAKLDAAVLAASVYPRYARFVTGAMHLNSAFQGKVLRYVGVIPKKQFMPDIKAIKEMMNTVKQGHILAFMPEGRISMDGTQNFIDISTAKLIKTLGCKVAVLIPHGSYFVKPPYRYDNIIPGPVSSDLKVGLTKEEVQSLSAEEILAKIQQLMAYDTIKDLRERGSKFGNKSNPCMKDVSKLLYRCPSCGKLYTIQDDGSKLWCSDCNMTMGLGTDPFFITEDEKLPSDITAWNKEQLEFEREYWNTENQTLSFKCLKGVIVLGGKSNDFEDKLEGIMTLSKDGLKYVDDEESLEVPIAQLPAMVADYQKGYVVYYNGNLIRRFKFDDIRMTPRVVNSLAILTKEK